MKHISLQRITLMLICIGFANLAFSQQYKVTGTVTDKETNEPIIGATVKEVNSKNGTITDIYGRYSISVSSPESKLTFIFIGKKKIAEPIKSRKIINVELEDEVAELQEVVAIGYGTTKKSDLTGSVSSLRSKNLEENKSTSLNNSLTGKLSGVLAVQNGGDPGAGIDIKIRGASSVSAGSTPLYVIDGILMGNSSDELLGTSRAGGGSVDPLASINPNDIESIEVLKDASATAIYGSRGANGVVIVTTKSGTKDGTTNIQFSADAGVDLLPQKQINALSSSEYEDYMRMVFPLTEQNLAGTLPLNSDQLQYWTSQFEPVRSGKNTVWQDEVFRLGHTQNYNFSLRGSSNKNNSYSFSVGYYDKKGIIINSDFNRLTYSSKISSRINKHIQFGVNLSGSIVKSNGVVSATNINTDNVFVQIYTFKPNIIPSDITYGNDDLTDMTNSFNNPVNSVTNVKQYSDARRTQGNFILTITPVKNLEFNSTFGGYYSDSKGKNYYPSTTGGGRVLEGKAQHGTARTTNLLNENTIKYSKKLNNNHDLSVLGGLTFQRVYLDKITTTATKLTNETLGLENIKFGENILTPENYYGYSSLMSYLGRINYNLYERYLLTASLRADGSSKFSVGKKFSYFPSAAFAWRVNEEPFLKKATSIDQLKLRLSYGRTGNQEVGDLAALGLMNKVYYSYNTVQGSTGSPVQLTGFVPGTITNNNLKWETTDQYNVGVDLVLWKGKLSVTAEAYYKFTHNLLITEQLPALSGYTTAMRNIGSVSNKGLEFTIYSQIIKKKKFNWSADLNITFNKNKVIDIGSGDRIPVNPNYAVQGLYTDIFYVREGYPIGAMFGYKRDGNYQPADFKEFYTDPNDPSTFIADAATQKTIYTSTSNFTLMPGVVDRGDEVKPGYAKFKKLGDTGSDLNPKINNIDDRTYLGSAEPLFFGGLTNRFTIGNFELSLFFQYSYGNKLFNVNYGLLQGRGEYNLSKDYYQNMWTIDRQSGVYQNFKDDIGRQMTSDLQAEDASYIKLKEIVLNYTLPVKFVTKLGLKSVKFNVTTSNLVTWTNYSWYDPEFKNKDVLMSGLDKYAYPLSRSVTGGVVVNF